MLLARYLVPLIGPLISQSLKAAFYMDKEIMFKPNVISSGPGNRLSIWSRAEKLSSFDVVVMMAFIFKCV